jgi:hypothetical protein
MVTSNKITASKGAVMVGKRSRIGRLGASGTVLAATLAGIAVLVGAAVPGSATGLPVPQATGSIAGKVVFQGTPPERRKLNMSADPVCSAKNPDAVLAPDGAVNSDGTLPNTFVYLKDVSGTFKAPAEPAVLDQSGCMYIPHVLGVMVDQPLRIISSHPTTHNIHFVSTQNPDWNHSQPPGAAPLVGKFAHPEIAIKVHCNEHPWMNAYVAVMSNPFYSVTGDQGTFTIPNVPPGEYTLGGWTATFGTQDQKVTVRAGQATQVTFTFKAQ